LLLDLGIYIVEEMRVFIFCFVTDQRNRVYIYRSVSKLKRELNYPRGEL